ncbi:hypothetical protein HBI56_181380 [Parastagonospora nodorum]|uniref:Uncharacterized protein n=1 Tax=Phaeosphaeria nodorum (strain SN15 / ATCC MYA-4574 / FGSC 10173) TaxID=321614 RepID=A0A7U2F976_PHANO|nr:hypothetical protein HBH56_186760 [Parastagonospora nodorum]QRD00992.1 hypothetical protein JI435_154090 [Parastagonospora nodorum SN15]KAH3925384.1 hypothetical protein HBH54_181790 [Parastagonospora nodorum]KAH3940597.1 hypothetical protein HBH53_213400 [Parastagonospora nodorum]KAH3958241.1 hypothetical protein HBH51_213000 [Parastagonospora nodorum]
MEVNQCIAVWTASKHQTCADYYFTPLLHRPLATLKHRRRILNLRLRYHCQIDRMRCYHHHRKYAWHVRLLARKDIEHSGFRARL